MFPFEPHELMSLIAPRRFLAIMGDFGPLVPQNEYFSLMIHKVAKVYELYNKENNLIYLLHGDGHKTTILPWLYAYFWIDFFLKGKRTRRFSSKLY